MTRHKKPGLLLAIRPTTRGFGWALFEGPLAPVDWGIAIAKRNKTAKCMARFEKLINQYRPSSIVLEKLEANTSPTGDRVRILAENMSGFASNRDIDALVYSRADIGEVLAHDKKATRRTVAYAVAEILPILRDRLPPARKLWQPEDGRQCLFDAAALGITHYALTGSPIRKAAVS